MQVKQLIKTFDASVPWRVKVLEIDKNIFNQDYIGENEIEEIKNQRWNVSKIINEGGIFTIHYKEMKDKVEGDFLVYKNSMYIKNFIATEEWEEVVVEKAGVAILSETDSKTFKKIEDAEKVASIFDMKVK